MNLTALGAALPVLERDRRSFTEIEYRQYLWDKKTISEKVHFLFRCVITLGDHFNKYSEGIKRRFLEETSIVARYHPSEITLIDRIRKKIPSKKVAVGGANVRLALAGVICVNDDGYVYLRMPTVAYQRMLKKFIQNNTELLQKLSDR